MESEVFDAQRRIEGGRLMTIENNASDSGAPLSNVGLGAGECGVCDFENAKLVSRAKWCCPNCGRDFSLAYLFWLEAAHPEWLEEWKMDVKNTQYGFEWGPVEIERACSDSRRGWAVLLIKTKKHPNGIQVYVTKSGKVRVHSDAREWTPNVEVEQWPKERPTGERDMTETEKTNEAPNGPPDSKAMLYVTTSTGIEKTHRQKMLAALHDAYLWHGKQEYARINKKKKLMHRKYQIAIWWAIENLETTGV